LARAFLFCLEQSNILDRNHRLVGEGLEQRQLFIREGAGFESVDYNRANCLSATEQGHSEQASKISFLRCRPSVFLVSEHVGNLTRSTREDCPTRDSAAVRRHRILVLKQR